MERERDNPVIVVEHPRNPLKAFVWLAESWQDAASKSENSDGQQACVEVYTHAEACEFFDSDDATEISNMHGSVCLVQSEPNHTRLVEPDKCPSLSSVVKEWISNDKIDVVFLESPSDVEDFIQNGKITLSDQESLKLLDAARSLGWRSDNDNEIPSTQQP